MKQNSCDTDCDNKAASDLSGVLAQQLAIGSQLLDAAVSSSGQLVRSLLNQVSEQKTNSCCDIPEPCWMPANLGDITCNVCEGARAVLTITVTNTDFKPREYELAAADEDAARISIEPRRFSLGPKERRKVTVTFDSRLDKDEKCAELSALVWVFGCRNHYLRWTLNVGKKDSACCHALEVHDGPDYQHHWYDHFYCVRPCFGPATRPRPQPQPEG